MKKSSPKNFLYKSCPSTTKNKERNIESPSTCNESNRKSIEEINYDRPHLLSAQGPLNQRILSKCPILPPPGRRPMSNLNALVRKRNERLGKSIGNEFCINNQNNFNNFYHKIKIERGMMSTKLVDKLINNFNFDLRTQSFQPIQKNIGSFKELNNLYGNLN